MAEEKKKAEEAEKARVAEEKKKAEEAEKARVAEEKKKAEEAEKARVAEEKKKAEEAEKARVAEEKKKAEAKKVEERKKAEEKKKAEEAEKARIAKETAEKKEKAARQSAIKAIKENKISIVSPSKDFDYREGSIQFKWKVSDSKSVDHYVLTISNAETGEVIFKDDNVKKTIYKFKNWNYPDGAYEWTVYGVGIVDGNPYKTKVPKRRFTVGAADAGDIEFEDWNDEAW